jgi:hypothetical protein
LNSKQSTSHAIAWGLVGALALGGTFAWSAGEGDAIRAHHVATAAQKRAVHFEQEAKDAQQRADECASAADLWKQAITAETTDVTSWLSDIFGPALDVSDATDLVQQAKAAGCDQ